MNDFFWAMVGGGMFFFLYFVGGGIAIYLSQRSEREATRQ